jgi:hypothetical protein
MYQDLISVLGKHIDSSEFNSLVSIHFPDFKKFDKNKEYKDKKSKVCLRIDSLSSFDDTVIVSNDPNEYHYFIAFFFGKDESEIPFGIKHKDNEATVIEKAGKPTHHNKNLEGGSFTHVNDLHYHFGNFKLIVSFDPVSLKQYSISIHLRLKGMRF